MRLWESEEPGGGACRIHSNGLHTASQVALRAQFHEPTALADRLPALPTALPTDETEAASLTGDGAGRVGGVPREYLLRHFNALREFDRDASQRRLRRSSGRYRSTRSRPRAVRAAVAAARTRCVPRRHRPSPAGPVTAALAPAP